MLQWSRDDEVGPTVVNISDWLRTSSILFHLPQTLFSCSRQFYRVEMDRGEKKATSVRPARSYQELKVIGSCGGSVPVDELKFGVESLNSQDECFSSLCSMLLLGAGK